MKAIDIDYFKITHSQLKHCQDYDIYIRYIKSTHVEFVKCDPKEFQGSGRPVQFYIRLHDRKEMLENIKRDFESSITQSDPVAIKNLLSGMMVNTLSLPNPEVVNQISEAFDIFMDYVVEEPTILNKILSLSSGRYSTVEHSINVSALVLNYCLKTGYAEDRTYKQYGLAGLFHDIGKAYVPEDILDHHGKLTEEQFKVIKTHPVLGERLLKKAKLHKVVCMGAREHHLKMDGSGYPTDEAPKREIGRLLGIIDAFEALTNHSRAYKSSHSFNKACTILKDELNQGKLDKLLFKEFVRSLRGNTDYPDIC